MDIVSHAPTPGIKQKEDGTYYIDYVKQVRGKRIHIYSSGYQTFEEAKRAMPRLIESKTSPYAQTRKMKTTLSEFLLEYERYRLLHVRNASVNFDKSIARGFLAPYLFLTVTKAFEDVHVRAIYDAILKKEACSPWKNRCFGVLRQMVSTAFKWRVLGPDGYQDALSILENIPEHREEKKHREIWTKSEKERFLASIEDAKDKVLFELFLALGARIGEFAGLTWDCFDAKRGVISIHQQLVYQSVGKWVLSKDLKTRESYRRCKLPARLVAMLKDYKTCSDGTGFMFRSSCNPDYPMSKATLRRKMNYYIKKSGVRRITPHCLRHGKATDFMRICKDMEEVKAAARYLGHSATMMVDTYGHYAESATEAVLRRLEKEG